MAVPITNASDLNDKQILTMVFKEYINGNPFRWVMGDSENAVIHMKQDTSKGAGDTIVFSLLDAFDPTKVKRGNEMLSGSEVDLVYNTDKVVVDYVRYAGKVEQKRLVEARTPVQVVSMLRPQIVDAQTQILRDEIIEKAEADYITPGTGGARGSIVASATSPNRTRVLFGAADSNYNSDLATAMANVDSSADKLSVAMMRIARQKALNVAEFSNNTSTRKVRPFRVMDENNALVETYVFFIDPVSATHLTADSEWKDLRDDMRSNKIALPYFNGHKFLGEAEGALVYIIEELTSVGTATGGNASTATATNLWVGAQAFGLGIAEPGVFDTEDMDYKFHVGVGHTIIRGTKRLMFNGIENGLIHVYASAVL